MKRFISTLCLLVITFFANAQGSYVEMADLMRSNGKIYVVLTVAVIILTGLIAYLISLDIKLKRLANRVKYEAQ